MSNRNPNSRNNNWLIIIFTILLVLLINFFLSYFGMILLTNTMVEIFPILAKPRSGYSVLVLTSSSVWIYQLPYIIPLISIARRLRKYSFMKGVIIGAVITGLIAGFCYTLISYIIIVNPT